MFRLWLIAGAANMLIALAIAASVGHGLTGDYVPVIRNIDTAREMHFVHALALVGVGIVSVQFGRTLLFDLAGWAFLAGIVFFCGGLYGAFAFDMAAAMPLIPFGGISFMLGWILFGAGAFFLKHP